MPFFNRSMQLYTLLSSRKTGLKQKILKFWTGPLSLQILSRRAYKTKCELEDRETLKSYINQYWNEIPSETLRKLIDSIQNKCVEVLQLKGNKCKYWILYNFAVKYKFSKLSYTYFLTLENEFFLITFLITFFGAKLL